MCYVLLWEFHLWVLNTLRGLVSNSHCLSPLGIDGVIYTNFKILMREDDLVPWAEVVNFKSWIRVVLSVTTLFGSIALSVWNSMQEKVSIGAIGIASLGYMISIPYLFYDLRALIRTEKRGSRRLTTTSLLGCLVFGFLTISGLWQPFLSGLLFFLSTVLFTFNLSRL